MKPIILLKTELKNMERDLSFLLSLYISQRCADDIRTIKKHKSEIQLYKQAINKLKKK